MTRIDNHDGTHRYTNGHVETMSFKRPSQDLDTVIIEGELLDPPTHNLYNRQDLEMFTLNRRIRETLDAMPRYGTHGHMRLANKHTVADLARAIETYEAATR